MRTLYLVDRVALRDRRLICRRGLVFVGSPDGSAWHAVIYDPEPHALEAYERGAPIPFGATTQEGLSLDGIVELGRGDAETHVHYLRGLGQLEVAGDIGRPLLSAVSWTEATRARRAR